MLNKTTFFFFFFGYTYTYIQGTDLSSLSTSESLSEVESTSEMNNEDDEIILPTEPLKEKEEDQDP